MSNRPSLRRDLEVRPVHRRGRRYIEVSDAATGKKIWLSDLGYSVAYLMDGSDLDKLTARARDALHVQLARPRLLRFIELLADSGFLAAAPAAAAAAEPEPAAVGNSTLALAPDEIASLLDRAVANGAVRTSAMATLEPRKAPAQHRHHPAYAAGRRPGSLMSFHAAPARAASAPGELDDTGSRNFATGVRRR